MSWPVRVPSGPGRSPTILTRRGFATPGGLNPPTRDSFPRPSRRLEMPDTIHLTVPQALVKFLSAQYSEPDGEEQRLLPRCFGIFGHGNVAGIGQALLQAELEEPDSLRYILGRNEQAMVHTAVAYARMKDRLHTYAVSTSVGPGA